MTFTPRLLAALVAAPLILAATRLRRRAAAPAAGASPGLPARAHRPARRTLEPSSTARATPP